METIRVHEILQRRVLVTRDTAHLLKPTLAATLGTGPVLVTIDFQGIEGVTPSFVDELLGILVELAGNRELRLLVSHPPTRLTAKFTAVGRSRGLDVREGPDGSWVVGAQTA